MNGWNLSFLVTQREWWSYDLLATASPGITQSFCKLIYWSQLMILLKSFIHSTLAPHVLYRGRKKKTTIAPQVHPNPTKYGNNHPIFFHTKILISHFPFPKHSAFRWHAPSYFWLCQSLITAGPEVLSLDGWDANSNKPFWNGKLKLFVKSLEKLYSFHDIANYRNTIIFINLLLFDNMIIYV